VLNVIKCTDGITMVIQDKIGSVKVQPIM